MALRTGVLCNDANMRNDEGMWHVEGDPTEGALLVAGAKAGVEHQNPESGWHRLDSIPSNPSTASWPPTTTMPIMRRGSW
jgi:magnesium-transporting ATPase (P-type)